MKLKLYSFFVRFLYQWISAGIAHFYHCLIKTRVKFETSYHLIQLLAKCVGLIENIDRYYVRKITENYGRLGCDGMQFGRKYYFLGISCIQIHGIGFTSLCYPVHTRRVCSSEISLYLRIKLQFIKFHNIAFLIFTNIVDRTLDKFGKKMINKFFKIWRRSNIWDKSNKLRLYLRIN